MGRISFFTMLTDDRMSWTEQSAINSAHDRADAAMEVASAQAESFGQAIAGMQRRMNEQDKQIKFLSAAIGVLAAVLRDNNTIDAEILDARLEAALLNAEDEIAETANTADCLRCSRRVARAQTVMTEVGIVCDRCHALG